MTQTKSGKLGETAFLSDINEDGMRAELRKKVKMADGADYQKKYLTKTLREAKY